MLLRSPFCVLDAHNRPTCTQCPLVLLTRQDEKCGHTFAELRIFARAIRRALSNLVRGGSNDAPPHNIGVLAASGGYSLCASWLAILWEGFTVVPLSAEAPVHRFDSILADAMVRVVLVTDEESAAVARKTTCQNVSILDIRNLEATAADDSPELCDSKDDVSTSFDCFEKAAAADAVATSNGVAYLYYTSGSSGEPKGVSSGHGPMVNRLFWMRERWPFAEDEVCCQRVEHVFIDFVAEVFGPLSCGNPIIVVPSSVRKNPLLLRDFIINHGVTRITLVPTLARRVVEAALMVPSTFGMASERSISAKMNDENHSSSTTGTLAFFKSVRLWILSGEALPWAVARSLARLSMPTSTLLNLYGSTEVAADITFYSLSCQSAGEANSDGKQVAEETTRDPPSVPIGRPISNCGVELMEVAQQHERGDETPMRDDSPPQSLRRIGPGEQGRVGMLYVYGAGLARGYWGRPAATQQCFPSYTWDSASSCYKLYLSDPTEALLFHVNTPTLQPHDDGEACGDREDIKSGSQDGQKVRFFCTGDLASFERSQQGGGWSLVCRGRLDQQIKINGRRLDLSEVEACLQSVGVTLGTAVALTEQHGAGDREDSDWGAGDVIGVVVSPETLDTDLILAECRRCLPSFAVPQVVVAVSTMPTLLGSGKVDRREVRRLVLKHWHHHRGSACSNDEDHSASLVVPGTCQGSTSGWDISFEKGMRLINEAVTRTMQSCDRLDTLAERNQIDEDSNLFVEVGISSVQAVRLVHELRRSFSRNIGLMDLYSHPSARALAQWLALTVGTEAGDDKTQGGDLVAGEERLETVGVADVHVRGVNIGMGNDNEGDDKRGALDSASDTGATFTIRPITENVLKETRTLVSNVFLNNEPLLSSRFARCCATLGPVGAAVVRQCHKRLIGHSIDSLQRGGGRVLVATDNTSGQVLGFTIGTELTESVQGSGFLASNFAETGNPREETGVGIGGPTSFRRRSDTTPWQKSTDFLLGLPLQPILRPVSALVMELLSIYQYERGWAYAPGEVMYISETGCRPGQRDLSKGTRKHRVEKVARSRTSHRGNGGVQNALMAEMLERRLLRDASVAGFLRAVTICTNAVTAHVARELGFREVARISPVQTYHPLDDQTSECLPWRSLSRRKAQTLFPAGEHSGTAHRRERRTQPGPFAHVAEEHADVILFEKVLAPGVPPGMLLGCRPQEAGISPKHSVASVTGHSNTATADESDLPLVHAVALAAGERWQFVQAGRGTSQQYCEMLALLARSLPALASSGRATRYMTEDAEKGQSAFLLLTAPATACGSGTAEEATGVASSTKTALREPGQVDAPDSAARADEDLVWTVAACISWRRYTNSSGGNNLQDPARPVEMGAGEVVSIEGRSVSEEPPAGSVTPAPWRELLVLAVGSRWRYRGLGAALVACVLAEARDVGDSHVHVRALPESVGFYERHGFRAVNDEGCFRAEGGLEGPVRAVNSDGECLLVHDLGHGT